MLIKELITEAIKPLAIIHAAPRSGDIKRNYSETSKALTFLNWRSTTSLPEGLRKTVQRAAAHAATAE
jgi:UDP-glucose 4-epimerase